MDRREFNGVWWPMLAAWMGLTHATGHAFSLADVSQSDATQALRTALNQGAQVAVSQLGRSNGFLGNEKVRIELPGHLNDAANLLRRFGQGNHVDELVTAMNRAAEEAVPMAMDMLVGAVRSMSVNDAKKILNGGDTAATGFFAEKTRAPLGQKFLPVVTRTTQKVGLAEKYNQVAGRASELGLMKKEDASIEHHVTGKALDGLYYMIGVEERKIRKDPVGTGSALLGKVFGALK
jgi:hypothetical protein